MGAGGGGTFLSCNSLLCAVFQAVAPVCGLPGAAASMDLGDQASGLQVSRWAWFPAAVPLGPSAALAVLAALPALQGSSSSTTWATAGLSPSALPTAPLVCPVVRASSHPTALQPLTFLILTRASQVEKIF